MRRKNKVLNNSSIARIKMLAKRDKKSEINKIFLGVFLAIILSTILSRFIVSLIQDIGFTDGKVHIGYWSNPQKAFEEQFSIYKFTNKDASWQNFLIANPEIKNMIKFHPHILWPLTQFTWLTTFLVLIFISFRFFKYDERAPKWLSWIMTQKTLSMMTMYELIIGLFFWIWMYQNISNNQSSNQMSDLSTSEWIVTSFAHGIIPLLLLVYSSIFLIRDKKASLLREIFVIKSMAYPMIYSVYYIILTIVWEDPYPIFNLHKILTTGKDNNLLENPNWIGWSKQLWKLFIVWGCVFFALGIFTIVHNLFLIHLNKIYNPKNDYEAKKRYKKVMKNLEKKLFKLSYGKGWRKVWNNKFSN